MLEFLEESEAAISQVERLCSRFKTEVLVQLKDAAARLEEAQKFGYGRGDAVGHDVHDALEMVLPWVIAGCMWS